MPVEWRAGSVTGMLPYSRMTGPPGDNYLVEDSEFLTIHEKHFPKMIHKCPVFTTYTVHSMLDRARVFKTSDLQNEKMVSLGKLAAGLASGPTGAYGLTKRLFNKNVLPNLEEALEFEADLQEIASKSDEHIEGVRAFLEKRKPSFG